MKHRESEQTQLRVSRLLNRDSVMLHAEMPSVQTALETLVELQESNGVITNGTAYYKAVCERERAGGTTAIGEGLAIPHACNAGVASLGLAALTLTRGLDWGAADGKLVDMIFMDSVLILPQECLNPSILTAQNHSDMYMLFGIYFPFLTAAHLSTPFMIAL